jgi:hypothetical protein
MGGFTPAPGLNERVARMVADRVKDLAKEVADEIKAGAPPTKRWQTQEDPLVRDTHFRVNGQEVPDNLRFEVPSMDWDREHRGVGKTTYMLAPKDETSRAVANINHCRCRADPVPDGISKHVAVTNPQQHGAKVTATVYCDAPHAHAAEYGDVYPFGNISPGTFFFGQGVAAARARLQA